MSLDPAAIRLGLLRLSRRGRSVPLLLCRITLGWEFLVSGWLKIHALGKLAHYFATLHILWPAQSAALVAFTELICGALLLCGLLSRLATVPLFVTMTVALATAKRADIHNLGDLFFQVEFTYLVLFVVVAVLGPGAPSLDGAIARAVDRKGRHDLHGGRPVEAT